MQTELEIRFSWRDDATVELYRKEKAEPADIVVISNPWMVAEFTNHFLDFMRQEGGVMR